VAAAAAAAAAAAENNKPAGCAAEPTEPDRIGSASVGRR